MVAILFGTVYYWLSVGKSTGNITHQLGHSQLFHNIGDPQLGIVQGNKNISQTCLFVGNTKAPPIPQQIIPQYSPCVISKSGIITPIYNSSHELYNPFAVIPCYNLIFMDGKCEMNIEYTFCGLVFRMECGEILILWLI